MSRTKSAFLGTVSSQFYTIISVLISLFSVPIIVKHLNAEIYGLSIIIFQITTYLGMFDFGLIAGVERYLAGTREDTEENRELIQKVISTAVVVYSFIAIIVIVGGNIFAPFAANIFNAPIKYIQIVNHIVSALSILLGFQLIQRALTAIFFAHQRQILHNTLSFILNIGNTLLTVIFISQGYGLWGFVYSQIIMFILSSLTNVYFFRKHYSYISIKVKKFDWPLVKDMFSYGFSLFLIGIAVQVVFQTDRIIIGSFVSLTAVSVYSFTTKIPELSSQVIWKVSDNSFPALVELSKKKDSGVFLKNSHDKIMKLTISCTSTLFWIIVLTSYPFIKLWVGGAYYAGVRFTILVAYLYFIQLTFIHVTSVCLNGFGIAKRISAMAMVEAVINLTLSLILVKLYGIEGVIIATIIGGILTSFWYIPYLAVKYFGGSIFSYAATLLKPFLICSVFDGILYFLLKDKFHDINSWPALMFYTLIVSLLCTVPIIVLNRFIFLELKKMFFGNKS
ncbi:oligosaccharide flippase family protein [Mucilaginibacter lappiensis]|uniref:O-antigen/teichoic acid export membrane protein n=1 Tax=Mucilaginibacter lappiensis TaxID=354630 RepID=A0A841J8A8_9SPHI|nr:oligosaccharide flippase family protein [Mucilaginibacter lappiensis]MBB6127037.1 O-antigen/teichoic acid export membrane protein [Mucilaginibacter lappiensis]